MLHASHSIQILWNEKFSALDNNPFRCERKNEFDCFAWVDIDCEETNLYGLIQVEVDIIPETRGPKISSFSNLETIV